MIRRGSTKYPLFPKGNHCPNAAKVFNSTTEDYRGTQALTYVHKTHRCIPEIQFSNFVCQRVSQICLKLTTAFPPPKHCHFVNSLSHQSQFNALFRIIPPTTLQSSLFLTFSLCPIENGTVCFHLRVSQSLMEPLWVPEMLLLWFREDFHTQTCRQALTSTTRFPHEAAAQQPESLVTLSPLQLPPKAGTLAVLSPQQMQGIANTLVDLQQWIQQYCSHQECLHSLQQISLVNSTKILR